jgi:2-haloacid dehalogenase
VGLCAVVGDRGARAAGLKTALVFRPDENGPNRKADLTPEGDFDFVANDFTDLADRLGC